jgi:hypothetical protein
VAHEEHVPAAAQPRPERGIIGMRERRGEEGRAGEDESAPLDGEPQVLTVGFSE